MYCFSRDGADAGRSDVLVTAPGFSLPLGSNKPSDPSSEFLSFPGVAADPLIDDPELSPALLQLLSDISPRSVTEMCLADEGSDDLAPPLLAHRAQPAPPARDPTPGPMWAATMPPPFPGPPPVPFRRPQLPALWFGQEQQPAAPAPRATWMAGMPASASAPLQAQQFFAF